MEPPAVHGNRCAARQEHGLARRVFVFRTLLRFNDAEPLADAREISVFHYAFAAVDAAMVGQRIFKEISHRKVLGRMRRVG